MIFSLTEDYFRDSSLKTTFPSSDHQNQNARLLRSLASIEELMETSRRLPEENEKNIFSFLRDFAIHLPNILNVDKLTLR